MQELKIIKLNDTECVRKEDIESLQINEEDEPLRIVMNDDRGLCVVGNVNLNPDPLGYGYGDGYG